MRMSHSPSNASALQERSPTVVLLCNRIIEEAAPKNGGADMSKNIRSKWWLDRSTVGTSKPAVPAVSHSRSYSRFVLVLGLFKFLRR